MKTYGWSGTLRSLEAGYAYMVGDQSRNGARSQVAALARVLASGEWDRRELERTHEALKARTAELQTLLQQGDASNGAEAGTIETLTKERGRLQTRTQQLETEIAALQGVQAQLIVELRDQTDDHIAGIEAGLAFTGLDIDAVIENLQAEAPAGGTGGPWIAVLPGGPTPQMPLNHALDLVALFGRAADLREVISRLPLSAPVVEDHELTSGFGVRRDPFTGEHSHHSGLDFSAPSGTPIYPTAAGTIVAAERSGAYGQMVEIDHGLGIRTRYAHLHRIDVAVGDIVGRRTVLGLLGSTGRSTGPHLHYEILVDDEPRDPAGFLKAGEHILRIAGDQRLAWQMTGRREQRH